MKTIKWQGIYSVLLVLFLATGIISAEVSFSCEYREYCDWDEDTETFVNCEGYEEASLFEMNDAETMFTHTTPKMKSTYYVKSKEYDAEYDVYTYEVKSDVGNEYYYVFDITNKEVRAVIVDENGKTILLRFYVKAIFTDD